MTGSHLAVSVPPGRQHQYAPDDGGPIGKQQAQRSDYHKQRDHDEETATTRRRCHFDPFLVLHFLSSYGTDQTC